MSRLNPNLLDPIAPRQAPVAKTASPQSEQREQPSSSQPTPLDKLREELGEVRRESSTAVALAQLYADPEIAAVLRAKQAGEKVSVIRGEVQQQAAPAPQPTPNFEEMSDGQKVDFLLKQVTTLSEQQAKATIAPVTQEVRQIQSQIKGYQQAEANRMVNEVKAKYQNFDELLPVMQQLSPLAPGLGVEDLYYLACRRTGKEPQTRATIETERPTQSTARPALRESRDKPLAQGRQGFAQAMREALARNEYVTALEQGEVQE